MVPFHIIATAEDPAVIPNAPGIFLLESTYVYVGIAKPGAFDCSEPGWYHPWIAIIAIVYSLSNFFYVGDPVFDVVWFMWSFLRTLFFGLLGLKMGIMRFTGWVSRVEARILCVIPASLLPTGVLRRGV